MRSGTGLPRWAVAALIVAGAVVVVGGIGAAVSDKDSSHASSTTLAAAPTTPIPSTTLALPTTQPTLVAATEAPPAQPPTTVAPAITIVNVVDGDTVDLSTGERVRIIGIDTPERGACGFQEAADALAAMVTGKAVVVTAGARDDVDKYGRILRYIDVDGTDVGLALIQQGLAIARYDSRDGYGHHPREETYAEADASSRALCAPPLPTAPAPVTTAASSAYYANCTEARAAGVTPLYEGEPRYRAALDHDHDGVACE